MNTILNLTSWMDYWMPMIRSKLDLDNDDQEVVLKLIELGIGNPDGVEEIEPISQKLIAFGAGPNLDQEFENYLNVLNSNNNLLRHQILAADGAAHKLIEHDIIPDYIFSDLDGLDLKKLLDEQISSTIFILAHGDNLSKIQTLLKNDTFSKYSSIGKIIWCTQGQPASNWINTLGFTDGDRGICYFISKGCEILLLGYDLQAERIGRWSKIPHSTDSPMTPRKKLKLRIATDIFENLKKSDRLFSPTPKNVPSKLMKISDFLRN